MLVSKQQESSIITNVQACTPQQYSDHKASCSSVLPKTDPPQLPIRPQKATKVSEGSRKKPQASARAGEIMQKEREYNKEKRKRRYHHQCGFWIGNLDSLCLSFLTECCYDYY